MPTFAITVDGVVVATVSTQGLDVFSVNVGGTRIDDDIATLNASGSTWSEAGGGEYLTWVCDQSLKPGQLVQVAFSETGESSCAGKTIEELFPDESPPAQTDFAPSAELYRTLRAKPKLRERFSFEFLSSSGASFRGSTVPADHGFGFTVLWNSFHPEYARVSLHTYTLDDLEARDSLGNLVEETISYGSTVELSVVA